MDLIDTSRTAMASARGRMDHNDVSQPLRSIGKTNERVAANAPCAVAFVLDITASMSSGIEAVKRTVIDCLHSFSAGEGLEFVIVTFTENRSGSFVSVLRDEDPAVLARKVGSISLAKDPDTGTSASGEDGDENVKHALAMAHEALRDQIAVAFVITDAGPHFDRELRRSATHSREDECLRQMGRPLDAYELLTSVVGPFERGERNAHALVLVPVVRDSGLLWFHQMAHRSGGVVLRLGDVSRMQAAWTAIVRFIFAHVASRGVDETAQSTSTIAGLATMLVSTARDLPLFTTEDEARRGAAAVSHDAASSRGRTAAPSPTEILSGFMDGLAERFAGGKRFRRRAQDLQAGRLAKMAGLAAAFLARALGVDSPLRARVDALGGDPDVVAELGGGDAAAAARSLARIASVASGYAAAATPEARAGAESCLVSLCSAVEALEALREDVTRADGEEPASDAEAPPLEPILRALEGVLFGYALLLRFPQKDGQEDFADAWSTSVKAVGSRVSLASAHSMACMAAQAGAGTYKDAASDRGGRNAVIACPAADDFVSRAAYAVLSGFPTFMDALHTVLISGHVAVFPSMHMGCLASALYHQLERGVPTSEAELNCITNMAHGIALATTMPAKATVRALRSDERVLRPVDAIPRILCAFLWHLTHATDTDGGASLEAAAEREAADLELTRELALNVALDLASRHFSQVDWSTHSMQKISHVLALGDPWGVLQAPADELALDPLAGVHPLDLPKGAQPLARGALEHVTAAAAALPFWERCAHILQGIGFVLRTVAHAEGPAAELHRVATDCVKNLGVKALLLRSRRNLYALKDDGETWRHLCDNALAFERLAREAALHHPAVQTSYAGHKERRSEASLRALEAQLVDIGLDGVTAEAMAGIRVSACVEKVPDIHREALAARVTRTLRRQDLPAMLPRVLDAWGIDRLPLNAAEILFLETTWDTAPPAILGRYVEELRALLPPGEEGEGVFRHFRGGLFCNREFANRHGHSKRVRRPTLHDLLHTDDDGNFTFDLDRYFAERAAHVPHVEHGMRWVRSLLTCPPEDDPHLAELRALYDKGHEDMSRLETIYEKKVLLGKRKRREEEED
eukprot:CAMPEP_0119406210 /NCGR_PEP_ID=MMETSP1335-20130426/628_1 /TAXON_ID=259385 /ORGANISM="Chrysoculter rhomboideus, Strain RCC1486" /LENGTH=1098 /DNA_ID=CAMNT_0007430277 /DNA_START=27 /DNA_END=3323 /DNA_ORIENTATION=+